MISLVSSVFTLLSLKSIKERLIVLRFRFKFWVELYNNNGLGLLFNLLVEG